MNGTATKEMKQEESSSSGSESTDSGDSGSDEGSDVKPEESALRPMAQEDVRVVQSPPSTKKGRGICKFFAKTGKCRNGPRCHFLHEVCWPSDSRNATVISTSLPPVRCLRGKASDRIRNLHELNHPPPSH